MSKYIALKGLKIDPPNSFSEQCRKGSRKSNQKAQNGFKIQFSVPILFRIIAKILLDAFSARYKTLALSKKFPFYIGEGADFEKLEIFQKLGLNRELIGQAPDISAKFSNSDK